ncbi:nose resistant to fluoxetine protein 6 isoform X2 [Rhipicephalus sanguineus]|uniref:nose resistant to fluoxetine protein 6 isoform X2 n=1 Tax=Rhipicephalus sanguineus TaxID=34632 RepID=UPI0018936FC6|nr:nose resistant to fluoxetine protein 6 isoform X2 [Rhipicephalus sanguineus]
MFVLSAWRIQRRESPSPGAIVLAACLLFSSNAQSSRAEIGTSTSGEKSAESALTTPATADGHNGTGLLQIARDFMASDFISVPPSLTRKLLAADLRPECSLALLRTVTALKKLEPWVLRLLDATGKYPTGVLQFSRADIGAFDECLETEVQDAYGNVVSHGQYCGLLFNLKRDSIGEEEMKFVSSLLHPKFVQFFGAFTEMQVPFIRIGLCFLDDCTQSDLQALVDALLPDPVDVQVENCVTATPEPWSTTQIGVVAFLAALFAVIAGATVVDLYMDSKGNAAQKGGVLQRLVVGFSAASNTRALFRVAGKTHPDQYSLSFLHGMRAISVAYIVLGHCYQALSDTWGRLLNMVIDTDNSASMILAAAFNSVDTFFFLSGFFLSLAVLKQKRNGPLVFLIAVVRRLIRTCVPLFFVIMCIYVLPRFVSGPDTRRFFQKYDKEIAETWWTLLLQIRNWYGRMNEKTLLVHLWYLSADFQLFAASLLILLIFKKWKKLALETFTLFSALGCGIALWTATNPAVLPFMTYPAYTRTLQLTTMNIYYVRPFYHAICFFSGCMTFILLEDFRNVKISKTIQVTCWCVAVTCALSVTFMKIPWYRHEAPSGTVKLVAAFSERVLWSLFLAWFTLACATGRAGFIGQFLSSSFFAPLSRLSFGVYLIHYPFIMLLLHASRERMHWSHFTQVTLFFGVFIWSCLLAYVAFIACEAPAAALDKLVFQGLTGRGKPTKQQHRPESSVAVLNVGGGQVYQSSVKL